MDPGLAILFLAVFEGLQLSILSYQAWLIRRRLDTLVPPEATPGAILADAVVQFMKCVQENKNGEAQVVGGFIRGAAVAAFEEVKGKIPILGGGTEVLDKNLEKLSRQNPWAGLLFGFAQAAAPYIAQKVQEQQKGGVNVANRTRKGDNW